MDMQDIKPIKVWETEAINANLEARDRVERTAVQCEMLDVKCEISNSEGGMSSALCLLPNLKVKIEPDPSFRNNIIRSVSDGKEVVPPKRRKARCNSKKRRRDRAETAKLNVQGGSTAIEVVRDAVVAVRNAPKRMRLALPMVPSQIKMAITAEDYPKTPLTDTIAQELKQSFWEKMREEPVLTVEWMGLQAGVVSVTCYGEKAMSWLKVYDGQTFSGVKLNVVKHDALAKLVTMTWKRTRVNEDVPVTEELQMLELLHPTIKTRYWMVQSTSMDGLEATSVLLLDETSADAIAKAGYQLHAGLERSYFNVVID